MRGLQEHLVLLISLVAAVPVGTVVLIVRYLWRRGKPLQEP